MGDNRTSRGGHGRHRAVRRRGFAPLVWLGGITATALLTASIAATTAGFTASIDNSTNTVGAGSIVLQEDQGATTCLSTDGAATITAVQDNAGTCASINKFGDATVNLAPSATWVNTTVTLTNAGTLAASTFTLTPGATCSVAQNGPGAGTGANSYYGDGSATFCSHVDVTIATGASQGSDVFTGTLATLAGHAAFSLGSLAPNTPQQYTISIRLSATNATNSDQGLAATLPLTWALAS